MIRVPIIRPFELSTEQTGEIKLTDVVMEFENEHHLVMSYALLDAQNYDLIKENEKLLEQEQRWRDIATGFNREEYEKNN